MYLQRQFPFTGLHSDQISAINFTEPKPPFGLSEKKLHFGPPKTEPHLALHSDQISAINVAEPEPLFGLSKLKVHFWFSIQIHLELFSCFLSSICCISIFLYICAVHGQFILVISTTMKIGQYILDNIPDLKPLFSSSSVSDFLSLIRIRSEI